MTQTPTPPPDLPTLARVFGRVGVLSFGGPAAQIALMHRALVEDRPWLTEAQFLRALSFCMLLPGPEAMQLATYAGWRLRGIWGGVIAGGLFVAPGALVICLLALLYAQFGARPEMAGPLLGIQAAVIAIVAQALWRLSGKALSGPRDWILAGLSFVALFAFGLPFPLVIAVAALIGALPKPQDPPEAPPPPQRKTAPQVLLFWALLWLAPLPVLWLLRADLLFDLAMFFGRLAVVTFGGAYAVLAYMTQEVVLTKGWLEAHQMVDALGLAETTPGPLILVTQFVGQLTGHAAGGIGLALAASALTLWMTFVPCFLWIFAGAPYVEALLARPRLRAALAAITAAVVGVIANLSLWFAFHVLFRTVIRHDLSIAQITLPDPSTADPRAWALTALAALCLWRFGLSALLTLGLCAGLGAALTLGLPLR